MLATRPWPPQRTVISEGDHSALGRGNLGVGDHVVLPPTHESGYARQLRCGALGVGRLVDTCRSSGAATGSRWGVGGRVGGADADVACEVRSEVQMPVVWDRIRVGRAWSGPDGGGSDRPTHRPT